jgi:NADH dehydrogenase [ubiquinone] 1 alpha subcomplex assembly factor 5
MIPHIFHRHPIHHPNHNSLFLHHDIAQSLLQRFHLIQNKFTKGMQWGGSIPLNPIDDWTIVDLINYSHVHIIADDEMNPLNHNTFDLVMSLLNLSHVNDVPGALTQIERTMIPDGLFIGCLFGEETLKELRHAYLQTDIDIYKGAQVRLPPTISSYDMARLMQRSGFQLPTVNKQTWTIRYASICDLLRELKSFNEIHFFKTTPPPMTRHYLDQLDHNYPKASDGRIEVTVDVLFFNGWKYSPTQPQALKRGSADVSLINHFS